MDSTHFDRAWACVSAFNPITAILTVVTATVFIGTITSILYNLYLHPLRHYPGPILSAATPLPYIKAHLAGRLSFYCYDLHKYYGEVVRIAPNELSYNCIEGYKDIYGPGKQLVPKEKSFYHDPVPGVPGVLSSSHAENLQIRRVIRQGFSDKTLQEQEPLMKRYFDLMITRLQEQAKLGKSVDIVQWFNFTTFDIIGDLTFAQSFGCLDDSNYHPWISMLFVFIKAGALGFMLGQIPWLQPVIKKVFVPKGILEKRHLHAQMTRERVQERLLQKTNRPDFVRYILDAKKDGIVWSKEQIYSVCTDLLVAGSETTATLLSGATYLLLSNPETAKALVNEIRQAFQQDEDINMLKTAGLPYLNAVIEESLRCYPPVAIGTPRRVGLEGAIVLGKPVPPKTVISGNMWATFHNANYFHEPFKFAPERFLGNELYKNDNKKALQPFLCGQRVCIGRQLAYVELRVILARLFWNFDIELIPGQENWMKQKIFTVWEKPPLLLKIKERAN